MTCLHRFQPASYLSTQIPSHRHQSSEAEKAVLSRLLL